jgi:protein-tyrosine phosphatase
MRWSQRWTDGLRQLSEPRVLVVCLANVCRSPMAERVLSAPGPHRLAAHSAGVRPPVPPQRIDPRAANALQHRGYPESARRSRAAVVTDFERFELVLAMDHEVLTALAAICPLQHRSKLRLFLDFAPGHEGEDMPDPYWGDAQGFEHVLDLCEAARAGVCAALASADPRRIELSRPSNEG